MTVLNMFKVFVGIGIIATPSVFAKIGIVGGNIGMIFIAFICFYTMKLQIESMRKLTLGIRSYSELGMVVLGDFGKRVVDICMIVSQLGFATVYLIFIGS